MAINKFSIWRMEFLHTAMWHDRDIDFARWRMHPAMWHVALESWQWYIKWQHPAKWHVAQRWHVIEFALRQHPAVWHVALKSWHWIRQVAALCNVAGGARVTCHWIRPNVRHIRILHLLSISTTSHTAVDMSFSTSLRNFIQIDHPWQKKWRHVDFQDGGSRPSWILGIQ